MFLFQIGVDELKTQHIRAKVGDDEDPRVLNNKRMMVEYRLKQMAGVQFVVSTVSGYNDATNHCNKFWLGFMVAFTPSTDTAGAFLFNAIHDTGLEEVVERSKEKKKRIDYLCDIVKDHSNACVQVSLFLTPFCHTIPSFPEEELMS